MTKELEINISEQARQIYIEDNRNAGVMTWKDAIEKAKESLKDYSFN